MPHVASMSICHCSRAWKTSATRCWPTPQRFAEGLPANNALLWGARGMGKSSLVKAVHAEINAGRKGASRLVLIEIHREDIASLPQLLRILRAEQAARSCFIATIFPSTRTTPATNR